MVGKKILLICSFLLSCSSANFYYTEDQKDASIDVQDASVQDIEQEQKYNHCYTQTTFQTEYPCITETICKDNYSKTRIDQLRDNCNNTYCDWNIASDDVERCLPAYWQGYWLYADNGCTVKIGVSSNKEPKYIGIAAIKQNSLTPNKVDIYSAKDRYEGDRYIKYFDGQQLLCDKIFLPISLPTLPIALYYAGEFVDPIIFTRR